MLEDLGEMIELNLFDQISKSCWSIKRCVLRFPLQISTKCIFWGSDPIPYASESTALAWRTES